MELIPVKDVVKAVKLEKLGGHITAKLFMKALQLDKINDIYGKHCHKPCLEFLDSVLKETGTNYTIPEADLARIPKTGAFVIIGNHPFGAMEGLILMKHILPIRPDFKVMANFLFNQIEPIKDVVFGVNPFESYKDSFSSYNGLRKAFKHVKEGHPLAIFPAGEVSTYYNKQKFVADREWNLSIMRFLKDVGVPVVPVYFHGENSRMFHLMGRVHPLLRTVKLPSEILNKSNKEIQIRMGKPIAHNEYKGINNVHQFSYWMRARTYMLESGLPVDKKAALNIIKPKMQPIAPGTDHGALIYEIIDITPKYQLYKWQNFSIYCAPTGLIPHISAELCRLREITFREVGEGTNKSTDTDRFDKYYHQLFIWDDEQQRIVGGYRIGKGNEILDKYGVKGFYMNTLFRINDDMLPLLRESIELGRSFIVKDYQRKPMSLFLLWKGIFYFLLKNEEYHYLIGPVSISNNYSPLSKQIMVEWINQNYKAGNIDKHIQPRKPASFPESKANAKVLIDNIADLNELDKLIKEIEPNETRMPVLLKKYLSLGGKIAGFNVDPKFNNTIDGLLLLDLFEVPTDIILSLSKDLYADVFPQQNSAAEIVNQ